MEPERTKELKRVAPRLFLGLLAVESLALPIFRSGGRTGLSFWSWVVNHSIFGPAVEYVPFEDYSRELEGTFSWYPVKASTKTFRTMEEAMSYFKSGQATVEDMVKNGAIMLIAGDSKIKRYDDLLADVRHDKEYHSIRSLVQPDDPEVRDIARVLVQAPDFISAAQEFVNSFTTYRSEVGDYWCEPSETLAARAGDCFTGDTPIWVRTNGQPHLVEIRELLPAGDYAQYTGLEIFTPGGFAPLLSVTRRGIRETLRLRTTSDIGITPTHKLLVNPLLHEMGRYKLAGEVQLDQIVHLHPVLEANGPSQEPDADYEFGWTLGLFLTDGTVSIRQGKMFGGESWRLYNSRPEYLERAAAKLSTVYPDMRFPIHLFESYMEGAAVRSSLFTGGRPKTLYCMDALLKIRSEKGVRARFVREFYSLFYNSLGRKKVPDFVLLGNPALVKGFWDGAHAGDGEQEGARVTCKNKLVTLGLATILRRLGHVPYVAPDHNASRIWNQGGNRGEHQRLRRQWRIGSGKLEVFDIATATGEIVVGDIAAKNCDDLAILLCSILRNYMPPENTYCAFGLWTIGGRASGHMWVITEGESGDDRILEATAGPGRPTKGKYVIHCIFNDKYCFSTDSGLREFDLKPVEMAELTARR